MRYLAVLLSLIPFTALPDTDIGKLPLSDIESAYWDCDYASTTGLMNGNDAAVCSLMFEELKNRKFNGDFSKFTYWWKLHKEQEHKKRAS